MGCGRVKVVIKEKVQNVLNAQINKEFYSAYLYLAMSNKLEKPNIGNCAGNLLHLRINWCRHVESTGSLLNICYRYDKRANYS